MSVVVAAELASTVAAKEMAVAPVSTNGLAVAAAAALRTHHRHVFP
jgi:hypothetical protein